MIPIDFQVTCSKVKVKSLLSSVCCQLNIFWPLHLINSKLGAWVALNEWMIPIDLQVTCLKVKVKPLFLSQVCCPLNIFWTLHFFVQGLLLMSRWSLLIFRSHDPRSRSNHSWAQCVVRSISFGPFTWSIPNLVQVLPSMSRWSLLIFRSHV